MSEDPFDSFVDLQMIDDTMNTNNTNSNNSNLTSTPTASQSPAMSFAQLPESIGLSLPQWDAAINSATPAPSSPAVPSVPTASELFKIYLQGQLSLMETNPTAAAAAAMAVAEVAAAAAAAATAANRIAMPSAGAQTAKSAFSLFATATDATAAAASTSPKKEAEASLSGFASLSGMLPSETSSWMSQLLQQSSLPNAPAVEPYQLLLNPSKSSSVHSATEEQQQPPPSRTSAKPAFSQNVMRRHSRKHSQSEPYPSYAALSESSTLATERSATGRSSIASRAGSVRAPSRRNSAKATDRGNTSHSDEDIEDEDMVNELISLRDGVIKHDLHTRRVPLPDEDEIRKMTPKERRQLRNKISARNFRLRRKEYIGTLEAEVKEVRIELDDYRTRCNDVEMENQALKKELRSMHDQLEMALAAAASANLSEFSSTMSAAFDRALLPASSASACTPVSPAASYAPEASPELLMLSPSASPVAACCGSLNDMLHPEQQQQQQALRSNGHPSATPMLTRSSSPEPLDNSPRLALLGDDLHYHHQNCSSTNDSTIAHSSWNKSRLIVH